MQGYECRVLDGMERALRGGAFRAMHIEATPALLARQGCDEPTLLKKLSDAGYMVAKRRNDDNVVARRLQNSTAGRHRMKH